MKSVDEQMVKIRKNAVEILPEGELEKKLAKAIATDTPLVVKQGFDPTAPDIHLGHTVGMRKLKDFSDLGHQVVIIVGDYTALVGDPSGRSATRPQLTTEQVEVNAQTYLDQFFRILDPNKVTVRRNGEWFSTMVFADILRLAGKMTLARMMEREDFTKRWKAEAPISIHELLYPLMQAYDSVVIKADVELGGTDQKFNLLTGRQIQEAYGVEPQVALTLPLLEGTDGVQKMSKSIGNYIGVTESPKEMFGKIMSIPDLLIVRYFQLVTDYPQARIGNIDAAMKAGENPIVYKKELGRTIVGMYYDAQAADEAQGEFERVVVEKGLPDDIPMVVFKSSESNPWLPRVMADNNLTTSSGAAIRLIEGGAVYLDGKRVNNAREAYIVDHEPHLLKFGKRSFSYLKWSTE